MLDRRKIRPDSPSKKSQGETKQSRPHNFLDTTAPSTSSEQSHDVTSSRGIAEKGLVTLKEYQKKKEALESTKKTLLEAKGKVNWEEVDKCNSLLKDLGYIKNKITGMELNIDKLFKKDKKITEENEHLKKNLKEYEEDYKKKQADLEAKQKELGDAESQFEKIGIEIAEQKKNHQDLEDYQKAVLALRDSGPTDDITSENLERSLDVVFTSPLFSRGKDSQLQELEQTYQERGKLSKKISEYQKQEKLTKRGKNVKEAGHSKNGVTSNGEFQEVISDVKERLYSELGITENPLNIQINNTQEISDEIASIKPDGKLKNLINKITNIKLNRNSDNIKIIKKYESDVNLFTHYFNLFYHCREKVKEELPNPSRLAKDIKTLTTSIDGYKELIDLYKKECECFNECLDLAKDLIRTDSPQSAKVQKRPDESSSATSPQNSEKIQELREKIMSHKGSISKFIEEKPRELALKTQGIQGLHLLFRVVKPILGETVPVNQELIRFSENHFKRLKYELKQFVDDFKKLSSKLSKDKEQLLYQYYLHEAVSGCETSLERIGQFDHEVLQHIMVELKKAGNLCSEIKKDLKSSENKLADLHKECTLQEKKKDGLQLEIAQLEKDVSKQKESIIKQRKDLKEKEKELNKEKERIQRQIRGTEEQLASTKKAGNTIRKELNKLEPAVAPALRQVDAARRQVEQAKFEVANIARSFGNDPDQVWKYARKQLLQTERDKLNKQMGDRVTELLGNRPLSGENHLTPRNAKEYSQKWDNLQPITHPQTSESLDLRDQEYVKASQTLLDRLAEVPEGSSQPIFWMRYGEIINRTIDVYKNPQPEGAKERLMKALETLDKANEIANVFLDVMYGKEVIA